MTRLFFIFMVALCASTLAHADGRMIRYEAFRNNVLSVLNIASNQKIIFKRFSGRSYSHNSVEYCEVQLKSTPTATTLELIYRNSNRDHVSVEFSYSRQILENISPYSLKYSSYFVSCSGDQYDTYRDCWEYDHYEMTIDKTHDDLSKLLTLNFKGSSCTFKL
ncbi:MAG: hypothetical protein ACOYL6_02525 [Bacteriovoracaceae bacterium]